MAFRADVPYVHVQSHLAEKLVIVGVDDGKPRLSLGHRLFDLTSPFDGRRSSESVLHEGEAEDGRVLDASATAAAPTGRDERRIRVSLARSRRRRADQNVPLDCPQMSPVTLLPNAGLGSIIEALLPTDCYVPPLSMTAPALQLVPTGCTG